MNLKAFSQSHSIEQNCKQQKDEMSVSFKFHFTCHGWPQTHSTCLKRRKTSLRMRLCVCCSGVPNFKSLTEVPTLPLQASRVFLDKLTFPNIQSSNVTLYLPAEVFLCMFGHLGIKGEMEILTCAYAATVVAALHMQESPSHLVHRARLDAANSHSISSCYNSTPVELWTS